MYEQIHDGHTQTPKRTKSTLETYLTFDRSRLPNRQKNKALGHFPFPRVFQRHSIVERVVLLFAAARATVTRQGRVLAVMLLAGAVGFEVAVAADLLRILGWRLLVLGESRTLLEEAVLFAVDLAAEVALVEDGVVGAHDGSCFCWREQFSSFFLVFG